MENKELSNEEIRERILKGIEIAFEKLIIQKKKDDGEFIFWEDGKIVKIKARDM